MKRKFKDAKGITLIALVITIIVLLILAGVTIATLTGENGILTRASEAAKKTGQASVEEQVKLAVAASIGEDGKINTNKLNEELEKIEGEKTGIPISSLPADITIDGYEVHIDENGAVSMENTISGGETGEKPGNPNEEGYFTEVSTINGEAGNRNNPTIPVGFKPVDEGTAIWGYGTTTPPGVNGGLVIEDESENQYVWIPVDGILGEGKTVQNAIDGEIILGRYVFDSNGDIDTEDAVIPETLGGNLKPSSIFSNSFTETSTGNENTVAKDIEGFIDSVRTNGGYYIARFEASQNTTTNKAESKYDKAVWNNITQPNAAIACQNLYEGVNSDLINSYAWDTAILFIQKYGQNNYSSQDSLNKGSPINTGISGDIQLNIYDIASNCKEWSTETNSGSSNLSCVPRGGYYYTTGSSFASCRSLGTTAYSYPYISFRPILYL